MATTTPRSPPRFPRRRRPDSPLCVIAETVKGKGISFMENVGKWHHGVPSAEQLEQALAELHAAELALSGQPAEASA